VTTSFTKTEAEIIVSANEDYEWLPQTLLTHRAFNPEMSEGDLLETVSATVRSLIDEGFVTFFRNSWEAPGGDAMQQVESHEIPTVLANPETWVWDHSRDDYYCLVATPKGEEAFFEMIGKSS